MRFLTFLFLLLLTLPIWGTEIKFNYQPAKNNLEIFSEKALKEILSRINGVKTFSCKNNKCEVTLYPLLVSYQLEGFSPFIKPKLERYLGLKTFYRYSEEALTSAANNIAFFLKNNGYLDVAIKSILHITKKGYAKLKIIGQEGKLYVWGGFIFKGNICFKPQQFYKTYKKPFGTPFSFIDLYTAIDLSEKLCGKSNYINTFVYYSEPFLIRKKSLFYYLKRNFQISPFRTLDLLSEYIDIFINNPFRGISFLFKPLNGVYPILNIWGRKFQYEIILEGNNFFSEEYLKKIIVESIRKKNILSPIVIQNNLINLYKSYGFFDIKVNVYLLDNKFLIKIFEGKRYRLKVRIKPPIKDFYLKKINSYYSDSVISNILARLKRFLYKHHYLFKKLKVLRSINYQSKLVNITILIEGLNQTRIFVKRKVRINNHYLKQFIKTILSQYNPYELLINKNQINILKDNVLSILEKAGCSKPLVKVKIKTCKKFVEIIEEVSCGKILKFDHTAFWIEGRIKKKELNRLIVNFYGKKFNQKLIDMLQNRISLSNLFESFTIKLIRVDGKKIIPLVEGVERKPFSIEGQIGFSSDEGYLLDLFFNIIDPFGFGSKFSLNYQLTSKRNLYQLSYMDDYFLSSKTFSGFNFFKKYEEHRDFTSLSRGFSTTLGLHLNLYTNLAMTLVSANYKLDSQFITYRELSLKKISLSGEIYYPIYFGLIKRGLFNAFMQVSKGIQHFNYIKTTLGLNISLLSENIYSDFKISLGFVSHKAPIFEKFYLGGLKNLKGFGYESIAPPGGGDIYWYIGNEWGFPLVKPIYIFSGYDIGNCVKKGKNPLGLIKKDIFLGIGGITAAGPIRFIAALPLHNRIRIQDIKYLFLIGFNF